MTSGPALCEDCGRPRSRTALVCPHCGSRRADVAAVAEIAAPRPRSPRLHAAPDGRAPAATSSIDERGMSIEARRAWVMVAGVTTTALTLVLFWAIDALDVMRSYTLFVPTGALGLGLLAGSGYGVAGWALTDLKFTLSMLVAIAVSMVVCYVLLEVIEYAKWAPSGIGFFEYYDMATREAAWESSFGESEGVGPSGYGFRLAELLGLTFGGLLGCAVIPLLRRSAE